MNTLRTPAYVEQFDAFAAMFSARFALRIFMIVDRAIRAHVIQMPVNEPRWK